MNTELRKELGLIEVSALAIGAMVSSGIFVLPGIAHAQAGPSVIISYVLAGILAAIGMLSTAELATAMPKAGGDYYVITRTLGPLAGSISGLLNWFSLSLKSAFALVGLAAFAHIALHIPPLLTGIVMCFLFAGINLRGTRHAARAQVVTVAALVVLMILYVVYGMPAMKVENFSPFAPHGIHDMLRTSAFVFVSYGGLIQISGMAEEVRDPGKTLPRGIALSLIVVIILYALMVMVTTGVLESPVLNESKTPITDGARVFMGQWGVWAMSVGALLAFLSTANAGILAASRYLFALSRDALMPSSMARVSSRGIPFVSVIVTAIFISAALLLPLKTLVEAASLVVLLGFMLACVCVIVLRESRIQNYRPSYRSPFYPIPQIAGILGFGVLFFEMGMDSYIICAILFTVGGSVYWVYGKKRIASEYALLHLAERMTSRDLVTGTLERELKDVIRERDDISADVFDECIMRSCIDDIEEEINADACFRHVASLLASRVHVDKEKLYTLFVERESQSSTVLTPFLAIPHIIIPGEHIFEVALIRAKKGIVFPDTEHTVHALFALVGTRDERNFHLRALANFAQIVQDPAFEKQWMNARNEESIRDVILLGTRQRER